MVYCCIGNCSLCHLVRRDRSISPPPSSSVVVVVALIAAIVSFRCRVEFAVFELVPLSLPPVMNCRSEDSRRNHGRRYDEQFIDSVRCNVHSDSNLTTTTKDYVIVDAVDSFNFRRVDRQRSFCSSEHKRMAGGGYANFLPAKMKSLRTTDSTVEYVRNSI